MPKLTADAIAILEYFDQHASTPAPERAVTVANLTAVLADDRARLDVALSALDDAGLIRIHGASSTSVSAVTLTNAGQHASPSRRPPSR